MTTTHVIGKLDEFMARALAIHRKSILFALDPEGADDLFANAASKLNTIRAGVFRKIKFSTPDFEYKIPKADPIVKDEIEANAQIKSEMSTLAANVISFRDQLKGEKFRLVNDKTNEVDYLGAPEKGVMTKLITDLENLRELY